MRVVLTRRAERQLDFCEGLAASPHRGTKRDDLIAGLRTVGFERRATIAFVVEAERVVIEGIYYGGQDVDAALRK